jgi:hypothetical protein
MNEKVFAILVPLASIFFCLLIALFTDHFWGKTLLEKHFKRVM